MALFFGKPQRIDVSGDGGVVKTVVRAGDEDSDMPSPGDRAHVHYTGTLESTGELFDCSRAKGRPFSFKLGRGEVISGWDFGVATMAVGERATLEVRHDYAYGAAGVRGRVPPHATLRFDVELLSLGDEPPPSAAAAATATAPTAVAASTPEQAAGYDEWLALPAPDDAADDAASANDGVRVLRVGGCALRVDALGPMVVNTDGTFSRITNWGEMGEAERARTVRVLAKRNAQRLGRSS